MVGALQPRKTLLEVKVPRQAAELKLPERRISDFIVSENSFCRSECVCVCVHAWVVTCILGEGQEIKPRQGSTVEYIQCRTRPERRTGTETAKRSVKFPFLASQDNPNRLGLGPAAGRGLAAPRESSLKWQDARGRNHLGTTTTTTTTKCPLHAAPCDRSTSKDFS